METVNWPTAATDLYRCDIGSKFMVAAPTNLSVAMIWVRALEPNACLPITQTLGGFSSRVLALSVVQQAESVEHATPLAEFERCRSIALREGVADTLNDLAMTWGMSWVDIARVVGVSVPALRKWRLGEAKPRRDNVGRIAHIAGLLPAMKAVGVAEPAGRLNVRIVEDCYLTLRDLIASTEVTDVLAYVSGELSGEDLLDRNVELWRDRFASKVDTFLAADGERAMRMRGRTKQ